MVKLAGTDWATVSLSSGHFGLVPMLVVSWRPHTHYVGFYSFAAVPQIPPPHTHLNLSRSQEEMLGMRLKVFCVQKSCPILYATEFHTFTSQSSFLTYQKDLLHIKRIFKSVPYLSVKFSSAVEERFADVIHATCVTRRVFQAGKSPTSHLEGTIQASNHIRCKDKVGQETEDNLARASITLGSTTAALSSDGDWLSATFAESCFPSR